MNYYEAINLLKSEKHFNIKLGLERISKVLELLGNPQDKLKCIHVAGTNGKGSVCSIIATVLKEFGYKVGLYTSPHIMEYTERIRINNIEISKSDFTKYFEIIINNSKEIELTEFEILTTIMFKYFADNNVDFVVLETGLGGRFDATNVIKSNVCAILTHIDYDHTERLGSTLDKIAFEKSGIIKENCPVITFEGYEIYKDTADEKDCPLILINLNEDISNLSLKGLHQQENLSLALACIRQFFPQICENTIQNALKKVEHPYRFQYIKDKNIIIDAAHNPNGIKILMKNLNYYYPNIPKRIIFGCLRNKDYNSMINELKNEELYYYHFNYPNSATIEELQKVFPAKEFKHKFNDNKLTVICGSFYMLKELLPLVLS